MVESNTMSVINKINESVEIIVLIIAYILCFIFINIENTEQISMYLFLILHILFLFIYFVLQKTRGSILSLPYKINIPLVIIFAIVWILILVSLSITINTFRILRGKYYPDTIHLGRDVTLKNIIKNLWIICSVMLLLLYLLIKQNVVFSNLFSINNPYNIIIMLSGSMIVLSSFNVYLSYTFARHQHTIIIPK
jgi:hypothetical protein